MSRQADKDTPHIVQLVFGAEDINYEGLLIKIIGIKVSEKTSASKFQEIKSGKYRFCILSYLKELYQHDKIGVLNILIK